MKFTPAGYPDHSDGLLGAAARLTLHRVMHMGHGAVLLAIRPLNRRAGAKIKIWTPRIAARPAAGSRSEPIDFCGSGGDGRARVGGGFRCRLDGARSRRLGFAAAVCPGGNRGGGFFNLGNRYRPHIQQAEQNADAVRDVAIAASPASNASRGDAEQPSDAALCDVKRVEYLAELDRGR